MPTLLNSAVQLKGTTGTNSYFISLSEAQPLLGRTPSTGTGFTLVSQGINGQLVFTSTLGFVKFENGIVQSALPNGDLTIQSTGSGRVNLNGNVYINGQSITNLTANFQDLTVTNLTVLGTAIFTSTTSTTIFNTAVAINGSLTATGQTILLNPVSTGTIDNIIIGSNTSASGYFTNIVSSFLTATSGFISQLNSENISTDEFSSNTATIFEYFTVLGETVLSPIDKDVTINPGGTGNIYISSSAGGYMDGLIIGYNSPQAGFFTDLTADSLTLNQNLTLNTATFTTVSVSDLLSTQKLIVSGVATVTSLISTGSIYANALYDNNNRVLTNIERTLGNGLAGSFSVNGTTATISLTNTGVLSLFAGTGTAISSTSGYVTIWNKSTLQEVTDNGSSTTHILSITNTTTATTSTDGALIVAGGIGVNKNIIAKGDVYSNSGSPYYNRLLYTPQVTVSISPPINPKIGDFWIDPSIGVEYQYVPDGANAYWIQFIGF